MTLSIQWEGGHLLVLNIEGRLQKKALEETQALADESIRRHGKIRILALLDRFEGWEPGQDWDDLSFLLAHDRDIEKIGAVGKERWRDEVLMYLGAGMRAAEVRYFTPEEAPLARCWVEA